MKVGVILLDHGEPPEYNEHTYYSFRDFSTSLIEMGFIPKFVLRFDRGTILQDQNEFYAARRSPSPELIDAWLHPYEGPSTFIPEAKRLRITWSGIYPKGTRAHYLARKAGPGYHEPDFYEMYGFEIYDRWRCMGGLSPFYGQTQPQKWEVAKRLKERYGDEVVVRYAYGIDPFPQIEKQTPQVVVRELVQDEGVTHLAVAEHFSVISDVMSTFHTRRHVEHSLHQLGAQIPIAYADQLGERDAFNEGVVLKVKEELEELPRNAEVAIFLSNHGFPLTKVGRYNAGEDCYHQNAKTVYESARAAIEEGVKWEGELAVFQVFGQYTERKYNPGGRMLSPLRALDIASSRGFEYVVDIPYEFPGDSVDVLVKLRNAYGLKRLPDWNERYETRLNHEKVKVKITSALFHPDHWIDSYYQATLEAVERVLSNP